MTSESIMNDRRASLSTHQSALTVPDTEPDEDGDSPDATDGMGSMEFAKEEDSGYYGKYPEVSGQGQIKFMFPFTGPSSNIAFTRNIRRAVHALLSRPTSRQHGTDARTHRHVPNRPSLDVSRPASPHFRPPRPLNGDMGSVDSGLDYLRLPPDDEMDALVGRFFLDTGALFPFVHGPSFMEEYERVKKNNFRKFRRSWLGLLNAILAMATFTSASSEVTAPNRAVKSEVFYTRAKALCLDHMLHSASLETGEY